MLITDCTTKAAATQQCQNPPRYFTDAETGWILAAVKQYKMSLGRVSWVNIEAQMKQVADNAIIFPRNKEAVCVYLYTIYCAVYPYIK
jgi:hypothetical protein